MERVLFIEDDINLGTAMCGALELQGYEVEYLTCADNAMEEIRSFRPDIIVLDIMLNGSMDGFEIARLIRTSQTTPILFTTSCDSTQDLKEGFSIPNTDYIRKPYKLIEVTIRLKNLLSAKTEKITGGITQIQIGSFIYNICEQTLIYNSEKIKLSPLENEVLKLLQNNAGSYVKRETIIKTVWNEIDPKIKENTLSNVITNLRKYFNPDKKITIDSRNRIGIRIDVEL